VHKKMVREFRALKEERMRELEHAKTKQMPVPDPTGVRSPGTRPDKVERN